MFVINNVFWKLAFVDPHFPLLQRINGEYTIGACDNLTRTIYINQNLQGDLLRKVLCHEITHAAMFSYNIDLSIEQQELIADLISTYGDEVIYITNKIFSKLEKSGIFELFVLIF